MSITIHYTRKFRRLSKSGNTAANLADNEVGLIWSQYSSTPFQSGKGMMSYSSLNHERTDAYEASIFYGLVASPPPVGNIFMSFLLLCFYSPSVSTAVPSSLILGGGFPTPQLRPGIWRWCITILFSSMLLSMLSLSSVLFCVSEITTGNETGSPSDVLGDSLDLCGTIIARSNWSP